MVHWYTLKLSLKRQRVQTHRWQPTSGNQHQCYHSTWQNGSLIPIYPHFNHSCQSMKDWSEIRADESPSESVSTMHVIMKHPTLFAVAHKNSCRAKSEVPPMMWQHSLLVWTECWSTQHPARKYMQHWTRSSLLLLSRFEIFRLTFARYLIQYHK